MSKKNTRQTPSLPSVFFTLGKPPLYQVFFFPCVFRVALDKELVCRVPERIHLANTKTLGKFDVCGSGGSRGSASVGWGGAGRDGVCQR